MSTELPSFDIEKAKAEIKLLVEKYEREKSNNRLESYSEAQVRKDFIDRLFKALGWDVYNEYSNTVTVEEKASKGHVDYGFRINDIPKFFVEAKSFKAGVDRDDYIIQAINYAWSKGCTWAILTNFEKLKVYNAEWKGKSTLEAQFLHLNCEKLLEDDWEDLLLLSYDSMNKNLLDKKAEKYGKRSRRSPVGKQLFDDLTRFREILTKSIIQKNPNLNLSEENLDEAVQKILDRIIFIRTVEDKEIEPRKLLPFIRENHNGNLWKDLVNMYREFDASYDSNLFLSDKCEQLVIGDSELETVIRGLYLTDDYLTFYNFGAIDADVLGNVYEQYLGHIIKKTAKSATIQNGASKRKEQGIYYTPTYIVDYIVKNTVGRKIIEMKADWKKIKILDPACGSGSFLIKTFDYLTSLDKELERKEELKKELYGTHIATERFGYLKNNIFGVDLDIKAVEISQLNLMIKATEKKERLPSLRQNIKHGNSLIDDPNLVGDMAFKWDKEFTQIIANGGFDVIIGNPPYVRQEELTPIKSYLEANYATYHGMADLFVYFFERELNLLREGGYFGMIVSSKWLRAGYGKNLRKFVSQFWIEQLIDFGDLKIFPEATIYPSIIIMKKIKKPNPKIKICKVETLDFDSLYDYIQNHHFTVNQNELNEKEWTIQRTEANEFLNKLRTAGITIEEYVGAKICYGIKTGLNKAFIINEEIKSELIKQEHNNAEIIKPVLSGSEIDRYGIYPKSKFIIFTRRGIDIEQYPTIKKHLKKFETELTPKKTKDEKIGRKPGDYKWYEIQDVIAYYKEFKKPKILWGNLTREAAFYYDEQGYYVNAPGCILPTNSKYVLGVLNSKLMSYFLKSISAERQGGYIEQKPVYVSQVPIKKPSEYQEKEMNQLVDKMLSLNKKLNELGMENNYEITKLKEEIKRIDDDIDNFVYDIYGLDESERKIIEASSL